MPHLWGRFCGLKGEKSTHNSPSWPQRGVVGPNIDMCITHIHIIIHSYPYLRSFFNAASPTDRDCYQEYMKGKEESVEQCIYSVY